MAKLSANNTEQANVEDTRLGTQEYAIDKLGVEAVELKWGQGAKDIGGEVKIKSLEKAQLLKKRGYIAALTPEAARVSGIPLVSDLDAEGVDRILG